MTLDAVTDASLHHIGLSPEEAVHEAAASAALAGQPVSQEWQERVLVAIQEPGGVDRLIAERLAEFTPESG